MPDDRNHLCIDLFGLVKFNILAKSLFAKKCRKWSKTNIIGRLCVSTKIIFICHVLLLFIILNVILSNRPVQDWEMPKSRFYSSVAWAVTGLNAQLSQWCHDVDLQIYITSSSSSCLLILSDGLRFWSLPAIVSLETDIIKSHMF